MATKTPAFTRIPNSALSDARLSISAKWLLAYLMSKPSSWSFAADRIAFESASGPDAVKSARRELLECGYLSMLRRSDGRMDYVFSFPEASVGKPSGGKPSGGKASGGKASGGKMGGLSNTDISKNDTTKNNINKGKGRKKAPTGLENRRSVDCATPTEADRIAADKAVKRVQAKEWLLAHPKERKMIADACVERMRAEHPDWSASTISTMLDAAVLVATVKKLDAEGRCR